MVIWYWDVWGLDCLISRGLVLHLHRVLPLKSSSFGETSSATLQELLIHPTCSLHAWSPFTCSPEWPLSYLFMLWSPFITLLPGLYMCTPWSSSGIWWDPALGKSSWHALWVWVWAAVHSWRASHRLEWWVLFTDDCCSQLGSLLGRLIPLPLVAHPPVLP